MHITVAHPFACPPDVFWRRVFFDTAYNEALFKGFLGFPEYRTVSVDEQSDRIVRHVHVMPPQKAPEVIRKLMKGTLTYEEHGTWTASDGVYRFRTIPSMMPEKISIEGSIRAEPLDGGKRMNRRVEMEVGVRIMLVGGTVERFLADEVKASYDRSAGFTEKWITEKGLQGSD